MELGNDTRNRRRVILSIMLISMAIFLIQCVRYAPRSTHGFAAYYGYARLMIEEKDFSKTYNYEYFNEHLRSYGLVEDLPNNIPTNAFALLPLSWLSAKGARVFFILISLALLWFSIILVFRLNRIPAHADMYSALVAIVFFSHPMTANVALGQIYFLLLFLFVLSLYGISKKNSWLTAVPIALSLLLKGYGVVPLVWLAWTKRSKEFFLTIAIVVLTILVTLPVFGLNAWIVYYRNVVETLGRLPSDGHVAYQCVNGFLSHFFIYDARWHPLPLIALPPNTVFLLGVFVSIVIVVLVIRNRATDDYQVVLSYSAAVAAGVITAPLAEEYHFVLFLPLVISLFSNVFRKGREPFRLGPIELAVIAGLLLLTLPFSYKSLQFSPAPLGLLAYPRLFGGLLMLFVFGYRSSSKKNTLVEFIASPE